MKTPELLHVSTAFHFTYLDETRGSLRVPDPSDVVARSIVEDYINSQLSVDENTGPALFWIPENLKVEIIQEKFKEEITKYLSRQKKWFLAVAMLADNDWTRYHVHNVISDFQRKCAEFIGWDSTKHEWLSPLSTLKSFSCPACGSQILPDQVVCSVCKLVLNKEKYSTMQFATQAR